MNSFQGFMFLRAPELRVFNRIMYIQVCWLCAVAMVTMAFKLFFAKAFSNLAF